MARSGDHFSGNFGPDDYDPFGDPDGFNNPNGNNNPPGMNQQGNVPLPGMGPGGLPPAGMMPVQPSIDPTSGNYVLPDGTHVDQAPIFMPDGTEAQRNPDGTLPPGALVPTIDPNTNQMMNPVTNMPIGPVPTYDQATGVPIAPGDLNALLGPEIPVTDPATGIVYNTRQNVNMAEIAVTLAANHVDEFGQWKPIPSRLTFPQQLALAQMDENEFWTFMAMVPSGPNSGPDWHHIHSWVRSITADYKNGGHDKVQPQLLRQYPGPIVTERQAFDTTPGSPATPYHNIAAQLNQLYLFDPNPNAILVPVNPFAPNRNNLALYINMPPPQPPEQPGGIGNQPGNVPVPRDPDEEDDTPPPPPRNNQQDEPPAPPQDDPPPPPMNPADLPPVAPPMPPIQPARTPIERQPEPLPDPQRQPPQIPEPPTPPQPPEPIIPPRREDPVPPPPTIPPAAPLPRRRLPVPPPVEPPRVEPPPQPNNPPPQQPEGPPAPPPENPEPPPQQQQPEPPPPPQQQPEDEPPPPQPATQPASPLAPPSGTLPNGSNPGNNNQGSGQGNGQGNGSGSGQGYGTPVTTNPPQENNWLKWLIIITGGALAGGAGILTTGNPLLGLAIGGIGAAAMFTASDTITGFIQGFINSRSNPLQNTNQQNSQQNTPAENPPAQNPTVHGAVIPTQNLPQNGPGTTRTPQR